MTAVRPEHRLPEAGDTAGVPRSGALTDDTVQLRAVAAPPGLGRPASDDTMRLRPVEDFPPAEAPSHGEDTLQLRIVDQAVPLPLGGRAERRKAARGQSGRRGAQEGPPTAAQGHRRRRAAAAPAGPEPVGVKLIRAAGELFITMGVVLLLFVSYQLWWTNVRAHQEASGTASRLEKQWDQGNSGGTRDPDDPRDPGVFAPGQGFAIIWIPKLDVKAPIAEGTDKHAVLDKGMVGHYSGALETAMPWDKTGNFALAGHRNTHGEPFRYINTLKPGDKVVVETAQAYYTYEITSTLPQTDPSNVSVIKPVPVGSGFTKPGRYITLTTCTPEFTSTYRLIVWGKMVDVRARSKGKPDALLGS